MRLDEELEDWGKCRALMDMVRCTKFKEQKEWFNKYLIARNAYELKYHHLFQYGHQPE